MQEPNAIARRFSIVARLIGAVGLSFVGACATTEEVTPPPPFTIRADHFSGSVYTGPLATAPALERTPCLLEVSIAFADVPPLEVGEPLTAYTRQVFVEKSGVPLRTRGELARGVTLVPTPEDLRFAAPDQGVTWSESRTEALWPTTTLRFDVGHEPAYEDLNLARWDGLSLEVSRDLEPDGLEIALAFEGPDETGSQQVREHVVLERMDLARGLRLIVPSPRTETLTSGAILELVLVAPDETTTRAAVQRGEANLEAAVARVQTGSERLDQASAFRFKRTRALEALDRGPLRRSALVFLSDSSGAETAGELALLANEETLSQFLDEVRLQLESSEEEIQGADEFGWFLESTTYRWLAALAASPEAEMPPELTSLLTRQTGELGRYPDLVVETVAECSDLAALEARVLEENRIFLEDSHPAARVRAYDWLQVRGVAPAGYDPLATRDERRDALAQDEEERP